MSATQVRQEDHTADSIHADRDYSGWWTQHDTDECCNECCKGEIEHE